MSDLEGMTERQLIAKIQKLRKEAATTKKKFDNILERKYREVHNQHKIIKAQEAKIQECVRVIESNKKEFDMAFEEGNKKFRLMKEFLLSENKKLESENQLLRQRLRELSAENQVLEGRLSVVLNKRRRYNFSELTF